MTPVSVPTDPPQPQGQTTYPISDLYRVLQYSSPAAYVAAFNVQPAPFDSTRRPKTWFDSTVDLSDPLAIVPYFVYRKNPSTGVWSYQLIAMSASEAATVNIGTPPSPAPAPQPEWEVPARALVTGETLVAQPMGLYVENTLLGDDGMFHNADRAMLQAVYTWVMSQPKPAAVK